MAATDIMTRDEILTHLKALSPADGQWVWASYFFGPGAAKKGRAAKDPDAPKREITGDSYMYLVNKVVWPVLKEYIASLDAEAHAEKITQLKTVGCRTQVASALWDRDFKAMEDKEERAEAIAALDREAIMAAYESWRAAPPAPKSKSSAASVSSGGSASTGTKKKLADMSEEERKAFYKARAAKAAATKAAKKAEAASTADSDDEEAPSAAGGGGGGAAAPKPVAKPVAKPAKAPEDYADGESFVWEHALKGKKAAKYERTNYEGGVYLYDSKTKAYLGAWDKASNTVDASVENPFEEDE